MRKIVVDSDIILDHLTTADDVSMLRQLMARYFCYTTIFNAIELFAAARSRHEIQAIDDAMYAMKVLGVNAKSAKNIARAYSSSSKAMNGLIAGLCIESKLPIATLNPKQYKKIPSLEVIPALSLLSESSNI
jgi:predicted nucleic acid-binding protein